MARPAAGCSAAGRTPVRPRLPAAPRPPWPASPATRSRACAGARGASSASSARRRLGLSRPPSRMACGARVAPARAPVSAVAPGSSRTGSASTAGRAGAAQAKREHAGELALGEALRVQQRHPARGRGRLRQREHRVGDREVGWAQAARRCARRRGSSARDPRAGGPAGASVRLVRPSAGETWSRPARLVTGSETADAAEVRPRPRRRWRPGRRRRAWRWPRPCPGSQ